MTASKNFKRRMNAARRKLVWVGFGFTVSNLAGGASSFGALLDLRNQSQLHGGTALRIRGEYGIQADVAISLTMGGPSRVVWGAMLVQGEAFDAGVASIPNPDVDTDASWMWFQDQLVVSAANNDAAASFLRGPIDVRAKRKLKPNDVLAFVVRNQTTQSIDAGLAGRILIALP